MFKKDVNIRQLQQDAFRRGKQTQYEKDLEDLTALTNRLHNKHSNEIERLKNNFQKKLTDQIQRFESKWEEESKSRLKKYKSIITEKESIIKMQSTYIEELEQDNKRLKKAIKSLFDLKKVLFTILSELKTYYTTVENSTLTMRQKLNKMSDILSIADNKTKRYEDDILDLIQALENKSTNTKLELVEKVD